MVNLGINHDTESFIIVHENDRLWDIITKQLILHLHTIVIKVATLEILFLTMIHSVEL